jgi:hypothetical protein
MELTGRLLATQVFSESLDKQCNADKYKLTCAVCKTKLLCIVELHCRIVSSDFDICFKTHFGRELAYYKCLSFG